MRDNLHEYVVSGLKKRKGHPDQGWRQISEATGVSTKTFERMVDEDGDANPTRNTLIAIAEHFETNPLKQPARAR